MAFFRLSYILRPIRTPLTIEVKSSSKSTMDADSLATSVPRPPMAIPMFADFRAGASLTPSPVIATTSPTFLKAFTIRSFCSGTTRAKMLTSLMRPFRASSDIWSSSIPVIQFSGFLSPICRPIFCAVKG